MLALLAAFIMAVAMVGAAGPATAASQQENSITMPDGSTVDASALTEEDWNKAVDELIASDIPRTVEDTHSETVYTFHVPVDDPSVPGGVFDFTVAAQKDGVFTPQIGGGSDSIGAYILLNSFDQNLILSGASSVVTAALCAIPAIGWVSCAAITAAVTVAATWIGVHGLCPGQLKAYIFVPERNRCVA